MVAASSLETSKARATDARDYGGCSEGGMKVVQGRGRLGRWQACGQTGLQSVVGLNSSS